MVKLVIFDLDGTLLNTLDDLADSCNYIMRKYNFPTHSLEAYKYFIGNGVTKLIERALPESERNSEFVEKIRKEFVEYYSLHSEDKTVPYIGIVKMLKDLETIGVKLAVASNKFNSGTQMLVEKYFGDISFASVLGEREGIPTKPDPQIVYDIMNTLGIESKNEILYVGDTGTDMKTSVNSGIEGVGVLWGFSPKEELESTGAVYLVKIAEEIIEIVKRKE